MANIRAGRQLVMLPKEYYPSGVSKSYIKGSKITTTTTVNTVHSSYIQLPFDAYLISIEIDVDTHQYQNYYTLWVVDENNIIVDTLIEQVYDTGQKVLPLVIPYRLPTNYKLELSIRNVAGVSQKIIWHANFIR